ncbi:MAG: acyl-CoA thioesterase [Stenotrophobium sp.]
MDQKISLPAKTVAQSAVYDQVYMIFPNDLNANDTVFGGLIMAQMDRYSAVVADRHAGGVTVTAAVDAVHFIEPARRGDVLVFNVVVNRAWNSSMEVGCRVEAEAIKDGSRRHILSAYSTFVAMGADNKPRPVPPLTPITPAEVRRYGEAQLRRELRLKHAQEMEKFRAQGNGT